MDAPTPVLVELPELADTDSVEVLLTPQRHWTLHLVQHAHLDIGYTDPQGTVLPSDQSYLDSCLELAAATDDWPDECAVPLVRSRALSVLRALVDSTGRAAQVAEFLERVREGRIELTAMPFNLHTETCSTDELHELLRPSRGVAGAARHRHHHGHADGRAGRRSSGCPTSSPSSGIRYLSVAHNWAGRRCRTTSAASDLPRLFRWRAPAGASVLVWRTDTPHGLAYMEGSMLGFDESYELRRRPPAGLPVRTGHPPYPHEGGHLRLAAPSWTPNSRASRTRGTSCTCGSWAHFADNGPPRRIIADTVSRWNETWAFPAAADLAQRGLLHRRRRAARRPAPDVRRRLDGLVGGRCRRGGRPLAATRDGQAALAEAQTLAGHAEIMGATGGAGITGAAPEVYRAASLFNEHTWGAGDPWTHGDHGHGSGERQWHWKYAQALRAHDGAHTLLDAASAALGERLAPREGTLAGYYVVNTCSWERSETVRLFLPESTVPLADRYGSSTPATAHRWR